MNDLGSLAKWLMASVLMLASCATGDSGTEPLRSDEGAHETAADDAGGASDISRAEPARVVVSVTGDLTFRWEGEHSLRIVTMAPEDDRSIHLFSVGFEDLLPVPEAEDRLFRWAFDVTGGYDGAGTYPFDGAADQGSAFPSGAFLVFAIGDSSDGEPAPDGPDLTSTTRFDQLIEGCTVTVSDGEASGSLACAALGDHQGGEIGLHVTWELVAK